MPIRTVRDRADLDRFARLPWRLYRDDPHWVPPLLRDELLLLDRSRHPFWKHAEGEYFLAERDGRLVGRVAAVVNHRHNGFHDEKTGFWGFFECEDDPETARALLAAAESWLAARGMERSRGPANPSTNETCGLLIDGFDSMPAIQLTYNPRGYAALVEGAGYAKAMDLFTWYSHKDSFHRERLDRIAKIVRARSPVTVRDVDLKDIDREVAAIKGLYNRSWERNWGFVPMTEEEFDLAAEQFKPLLRPHLSFLAELDGRPIGFSMAVPDINPILKRIDGRLFPFGWARLLWGIRRLTHIRVIILGVLPEHQKMGVGTLLYQAYVERSWPVGYASCENGWVLETNGPMNKALEEMGSKRWKTYRMYEKALNAGR